MRTIPIDPADAAALTSFVELPFALHAADPRWVPPLRAPLAAELTGGSAFARYGRMRLFVCEDGGRLRGRVAAIVNPRLSGAAGSAAPPRGPIGQLGYFEAEDDDRVVASLFDAAFAWLRGEGARAAWGPMNGGAHRLHRFMTKGVERTPFLFEPRNPPYYPRLFEAQGFARVHEWHSFDVTRIELEGIQALLEAGTAPVAAEGRYRTELLDPRDMPRALARLHPLLDGVWAGHVGYASLDLAEFAEVFAGLLALITERHIGFLVETASGRDVGCAFMYPDWVDEVRALAGDAAGWGAWLGAGRRPARLVLHTTAVLPEARRTGGPYMLIERGIRHTLEDGFEELVVGLVDADWRLFRKVAEPTREYALYGRGI